MNSLTTADRKNKREDNALTAQKPQLLPKQNQAVPPQEVDMVEFISFGLYDIQYQFQNEQ